MAAVEWLGFLGGGIGIFFGLPQVRQVRAVGHGQGVSLLTWIMLFAGAASWAGYGIRIGSISVTVTNVAAAVINGCVVVTVHGRGRKPLLWLAALTVGLLVFVLTTPGPLVSTLLVMLMFGQVPQVYQSSRNVREQLPSAVSLTALRISLLSLLCWEVYALVAHSGVILVTTTMGLVMNLTIIALEMRAQHLGLRLATAGVPEPGWC